MTVRDAPVVLQERYVNVVEADRLEEWPVLFTENCVY
jgi:hypothetical protein